MNNSNIDNLLNSFIDGELDTREQVKIKRMISHDHHMARRLRQLKNLKALLGSLPKQEAPADTMQQVKALWERDSLLDDFSYQEPRIHSLRHRVLRRVRAAAAMIGLVTVLFVLVYSIVLSPPGDESTMPTHPLSDAAGDPKGMGAGMIKRPFEGKLELHCSSLSEVDHYIRRAIEDHGFTAVRDEETFNTRIYRIGCDKQGLKKIMNEVGRIWEKFDMTSLTVKDSARETSVIVDAVNAQQVIDIVSQDNTQGWIARARQIAVLNSMDECYQGRQLLTSIHQRGRPMSAMPIPVLTSSKKDQRTATASLAADSDISVWITLIIQDGK